MSIYQRKDRHDEWWISLRAHSGRRIRRKARIQSLEGAIQQEQAIRAQLARGQEMLDAFPLYGGSTFAEFAERWMTDYVQIANRASTAEEKRYALRCRLLPAFGRLRLEEISTGLVDAQAANWIKSGLSVKRVNNILTIFRKSLGCAVEWGLLAQVPLIRHHKYFPPIPRFLTREESTRLLDSMEPGFWRTVILFLLRTGARFGEAAALRWEDLALDADPPTVRIQRGVCYGNVADTKTKASRRTLVLVPELVIALRALRFRPPDSEWVFTSPSGQFYWPGRCGHVLKNACEKAGVPIISWHKLRHSCATQLLACGAPLPAIKEVLGHTSLEVTSIYTHVAPGLMWEYMKYLSTVPTPGEKAGTIPLRMAA
jgi:integrase